MATFDIGTGPNKIPPGATLKLILGGSPVETNRELLKKGFLSELTGIDGGDLLIETAGGGGATALIYKGPNETAFKKENILMIAGGGGGAVAALQLLPHPIEDRCRGEMEGRPAQKNRAGGDGFAGIEIGDNPLDLDFGNGGVDGAGGGAGGGLTGGAGGGGLNSIGANLSCNNGSSLPTIVGNVLSSLETGGKSSFPEFSNGGLGGSFSSCPFSPGGAGFIGGGSGLFGGGGGGGYSGGGGGAFMGSGGGGGSFIHSMGRLVSAEVFEIYNKSNEPRNAYLLMKNASPVIRHCNRIIELELNANGERKITADEYLTIRGVIDDPLKVTAQDEIVVLDDGKIGFLEFNLEGKTQFDCSDVTHGSDVDTLTLTVTDPFGQTAVPSCIDFIKIIDKIPPKAVCKNITLPLDINSGIAFINGQDIDGGSSDACGIKFSIVDKGKFTCSDIGLHTVTLTVSDNSSNTSSCAAIVQVVDITSPFLSCPENQTVNTDAETCGATVSFIVRENSHFDNCEEHQVEQTAGLASGSLFPIGITTNTLKATDAVGNTNICSFQVIVEDKEAPQALCQNLTIELDDNGTASISPQQIGGGSTDACEITSFRLDIQDFDCSNLGSNTVSLSLDDPSGNESTCTATVLVEDNILPTITCPAIQTVNTDAGVCGATVNFTLSSSDNCAGAIREQTADLISGTLFPLGTTLNSFKVTDVAGNSNTCSFQIIVQDREAPETICQNLTIELDDNGTANISPSQINNGSTDACAVDNIRLDKEQFDCSNLGSNTVILTVADPSGNESTCTAIVLVEDNIQPIITCPANRTVNTDAGVCGATVSFTLTSSDNCAGAIREQTAGLISGTLFPLGTTLNSFKVTDVAGNSQTCSFQIIVQDREAPETICQNLTIELDDNGTASISPQQINNGSTDACAVDNIRLNKEQFDCSNLGSNTVSLTVADPSGNESTCTATVLVEDNILPIITCPAAITVVCDTSTMTTKLPDLLDNCDTDPFLEHSTIVISGDCDWFCQLERTFVTLDGSNNESRCVQKIEKNTSPLIQQALALDADQNGVPDPFILGFSKTTLRIEPESAACVRDWMPYEGTNPIALERNEGTVNTDCLPGLNAVNSNGKIINPLLGEALKLALILRLSPNFGETTLSSLSCKISPIVAQNLSNNPDLDELMDLTNKALGNVVLIGSLDNLLDLLKCVNAPIAICDFE